MDEDIVVSKTFEIYTNDDDLEGNVIDQNSGNKSNDNESNSEDNLNPAIAVRYYLQSIEEEEQNEDEIHNNINNNNDSNSTEIIPNNNNQTNDVEVIRPTIVQRLGLPEAIPIGIVNIIENQDRESSESEQEHNNHDNIEEEDVNDFILKKHLVYSFSLLCISCLVLFTILQFPNETKKTVDKNSTETETGLSGLHNSTISSSSSNNTNHSLNNNITATTTQISFSETCLTDPIMIHNLEFEYYEEQGDTSIPRYYHICGNTTMNVFNLEPRFYTYDFGSGDVFPLAIFSPNVNILCGEYGDYSDNCTFSGGFFQVSL